MINTIVKYKDAYIMVGDFTNFFDKIDYKILKDRILKVLETNRLSDDWYNIYRSITKYGYYEKTLLIKQFESDNKFKNTSTNSYFNSVKEFRKFQRLYPSKKNSEIYGILQPQLVLCLPMFMR